jgi:tRNA A37 threonylcarbamoyladenosine biosynthesis protein TsaE
MPRISRIPELLEDGVTLIEWGDNLAPALPMDRLEIRIVLGQGRRRSPSRAHRCWAGGGRRGWADLETAVADWRVA